MTPKAHFAHWIGILIAMAIASFSSESLRAAPLPDPAVCSHLEPVDFPVSEFVGDARFVESPSFEKGSCWVILEENDKFLLTVYSLPPDTRPYKDFPEPTARIEIPASVAKLVREIWGMAMMEVRYAPKKRLGVDGTTYTFSTYTDTTRSMHGTTWSPEAEAPPKWMVEAGHDVLAFAHSTQRDSVSLERKLNETKKKLLGHSTESAASGPLPNHAAQSEGDKSSEAGNTQSHIGQVLRSERVRSVIEETGRKLGIDVRRQDGIAFNDLEGPTVDHRGFTLLAKLTVREELLSGYVLALTQGTALAIKNLGGQGPMIDSYTDTKRQDLKPMLKSRIQYTRGDVRGLICIFGIQTSNSEGSLAITCYEHRDSQKGLPNLKEKQSEE